MSHDVDHEASLTAATLSSWLNDALAEVSSDSSHIVNDDAAATISHAAAAAAEEPDSESEEGAAAAHARVVQAAQSRLPLRIRRLTIDYPLTRYSNLCTRVVYTNSPVDDKEEESADDAERDGVVGITAPLPASSAQSHSQSQSLSLTTFGHLLDVVAHFYSTPFTHREEQFLKACLRTGKLSRGSEVC